MRRGQSLFHPPYEGTAEAIGNRSHKILLEQLHKTVATELLKDLGDKVADLSPRPGMTRASGVGDLAAYELLQTTLAFLVEAYLCYEANLDKTQTEITPSVTVINRAYILLQDTLGEQKANYIMRRIAYHCDAAIEEVLSVSRPEKSP